MLSYLDFETHINTIKHYYDKDSEISDILDVDGIVCYTSKAISSIVSLLEILMDDKESEWIQFWCWECDFGQDAKDRAWDKEENVIPLNTIKDLYDALIKNL